MWKSCLFVRFILTSWKRICTSSQCESTKFKLQWRHEALFPSQGLVQVAVQASWGPWFVRIWCSKVRKLLRFTLRRSGTKSKTTTDPCVAPRRSPTQRRVKLCSCAQDKLWNQTSSFVSGCRDYSNDYSGGSSRFFHFCIVSWNCPSFIPDMPVATWVCVCRQDEAALTNSGFGKVMHMQPSGLESSRGCLQITCDLLTFD